MLRFRFGGNLMPQAVSLYTGFCWIIQESTLHAWWFKGSLCKQDTNGRVVATLTCFPFDSLEGVRKSKFTKWMCNSLTQHNSSSLHYQRNSPQKGPAINVSLWLRSLNGLCDDPCPTQLAHNRNGAETENNRQRPFSLMGTRHISTWSWSHPDWAQIVGWRSQHRAQGETNGYGPLGWNGKECHSLIVPNGIMPNVEPNNNKKLCFIFLYKNIEGTYIIISEQWVKIHSPLSPLNHSSLKRTLILVWQTFNGLKAKDTEKLSCSRLIHQSTAHKIVQSANLWDLKIGRINHEEV